MAIDKTSGLKARIDQLNQKKMEMAQQIIELLIDHNYSYAEAERMLDMARRMLKTYVPSKKRIETEIF